MKKNEQETAKKNKEEYHQLQLKLNSATLGKQGLEKQMDEVVQRLTTDTCLLSGYEEWDEGKDKKWILKFMVCDSEYEFVPDLN